MNITIAAAKFHIGHPVSLATIVQSGEFRRTTRSYRVPFMVIQCGGRKRKTVLLFESGKAIGVLKDTDDADLHIHLFCRKMARRIDRSLGITRKARANLEDYKVSNLCTIINGENYPVQEKYKTENGGKVRFFRDRIIVSNCKTREALEEALNEAKERNKEDTLRRIQI